MAETLMELVAKVTLDDSTFKSGLMAVQSQAQSAGNGISNAFNETPRPTNAVITIMIISHNT